MTSVQALAELVVALPAWGTSLKTLDDRIQQATRRPCVGRSAEDFFPDTLKGRGAAVQAAAHADTICRDRYGNLCPVAADCLILALRGRIDFGVYGGVDEGNRRRIRRVLDGQARHIAKVRTHVIRPGARARQPVGAA